MTNHTPGLIVQSACDALAELGARRHPSEVAARLAAANVVGRRRSAEFCPVAIYLMQRSGAVVVSVSNRFARIGVEDLGSRPAWYDVGELPIVVTAFIRAFDQGSYPNLVLAPLIRCRT